MARKNLNKLTVSVENTWQLCPKCQGHGSYFPYHSGYWPQTTISTAPVICDLCNGAKVISSITGKPPF